VSVVGLLLGFWVVDIVVAVGSRVVGFDVLVLEGLTEVGFVTANVDTLTVVVAEGFSDVGVVEAVGSRVLGVVLGP
jgi:uncharacterized membrane protein (Fun14 family)